MRLEIQDVTMHFWRAMHRLWNRIYLCSLRGSRWPEIVASDVIYVALFTNKLCFNVLLVLCNIHSLCSYYQACVVNFVLTLFIVYSLVLSAHCALPLVDSLLARVNNFARKL